MSTNGRWPQKLKVDLSPGDQTKMINTWNDDDLKIFKVEYLSNHWSDLPQILNLRSGDQTKIKKMLKFKTTSNGRWPQKNLKLNISATIDPIFLKF